MRLIIKNGYLVDPKRNIVDKKSILIEGNKIVKISDKIDPDSRDEIIDAAGLYVMPGFIDMNAHLRDPGDTESEDIETASEAAAAGGFTTVCAMPDTRPATDCVDNIKYIKIKSMDLSNINIIPAASLTLGCNGEKLVDFDTLFEYGVRLFSEGSKSVTSAFLMDQIMKKSADLGFLVCDHCEDPLLSRDGVINASEVADNLSLKGIPNIAEDSMLSRNLCIARHHKARYHVCHCSTKGSVELISIYKQLMGGNLSAEVSPNHIFFCDEDITEDDSNFKISPPLRSPEDKKALIEGLKNGTIDVIASNHSPHLLSYKQLGFRNSPFGTISFKTTFSLCVMSLLETGVLTLPELVAKLSYNPARILGLEKGLIQEGLTADLCIADIHQNYIFTADMIKSKSNNSPLINRELKGGIKYTVVNGKIIYKDVKSVS